MRRALPILLLACATAGCTSWQSGVQQVGVTGDDIVYLRDDRTGLCFAVLLLGNKLGTSVSEMAMVQVDCESLDGAPVR